MYFRGLYISKEKENKQTPATHHIKYQFCSMRLSCVVSQYLLVSLGDSHYFLLRMLLSYDMNQIHMVVGPHTFTQAEVFPNKGKLFSNIKGERQRF
jgi:hypothetical protein